MSGTHEGALKAWATRHAEHSTSKPMSKSIGSHTPKTMSQIEHVATLNAKLARGPEVFSHERRFAPKDSRLGKLAAKRGR